MDLDWMVRAPFFIDEGQAHIGLDGHVGLPADVEVAFHDAVGAVKQSRGFLALGDFGVKENIGGTRMDLGGVFGHGCRGAHVGRQFFQFHIDFVGRGAGMGFGIGADNGNGIPVLKHFGIGQDGAVESVAAMGIGKDHQTVNAVFCL